MPQSAGWLPQVYFQNQPGWQSGGLIDATGEKVAYIGRMWNASGLTKSIRKLHFPFGTVVKAGGSGLTVSLQDVSLSAGPAMQPDGTQDQTVAIANGDASFASNTWCTTGNLSADRSIAFGERLAIVFEFDGSGRLGSDSVVIRSTTLNVLRQSGGVLYTGSWGTFNGSSAVLLEFSDGTFGALDGSYPVSGLSAANYSTGSESALRFRVPYDCACDGAWLSVFSASGGDFDVVLYSGTTALVTVTVDANAVAAVSNSLLYVTFPEQSLVTATDYYLSVKPTTANSVTFAYVDVASASHWAAFPGGSDFTYASRTGTGAWTETTTRRPLAGVRLYPSGSGGGLIRHPGMLGGLNA